MTRAPDEKPVAILRPRELLQLPGFPAPAPASAAAIASSKSQATRPGGGDDEVFRFHFSAFFRGRDETPGLSIAGESARLILLSGRLISRRCTPAFGFESHRAGIFDF